MLKKLIKLWEDPRAIASLQERENDINSGDRALYEEKDYWHNQEIDRILGVLRRTAWGEIMNDPDAVELRAMQTARKRQRLEKSRKTGEYKTILAMYK